MIFLCLPGMEFSLYDVMNCIKNFQNVSNEHASNIASIKELCKIRDKVVYSELSLFEANTLTCYYIFLREEIYTSIVYLYIHYYMFNYS